MGMDDLIKIKDQYIELTKGLIDYNKFNNYHITHHSTAIEGSTLSYQEVILLLENGVTPGSGIPFTHLLMAKDHLEALKYTLELADRKEKLTVSSLQHISSLLLRNTGSQYNMMGGSFDAAKGEFRKGGVHVGPRSFPNYLKVPKLVECLVEDINSQIEDSKDFVNNSVLAFDAHFQLVSIHPFADGNGRISRLIMNYIQHYHGQPITPVLSEDKKFYYEALENTRQHQDPNIFREFMFGQSRKFFESEVAIMTQKQVYKKGNGKGISFLF